MPKKCPPGIICIENMTIVLLLIVLFIILYFMYSKNKNNQNPIIIREKINNDIQIDTNNNPYNSDSVLLNPYVPPLKKPFISNFNIFNPFQPPIRYNTFNPTYDIRSIPGIPINIKTQGYDTSYRQVGILTRINGPETILPLMGRPLLTNRDQWNFYTMNDKNNMIKLPVSYKGKSCTNEYGCNNIYNGDNVYVEGYNDAFKATIYDTDSLKYIPYL